MPFTLGQRWISDTESELGLGTVVAVDARMVTLLFPATGENRLYARNDSPVTRVMFNPGDTVTSHDGWQLKIEDVKEENGLLAYIGTRLDTDEANVILREVLLDNEQYKDCFLYRKLRQDIERYVSKLTQGSRRRYPDFSRNTQTP